jgi:hypothetical protein
MIEIKQIRITSLHSLEYKYSLKIITNQYKLTKWH